MVYWRKSNIAYNELVCIFLWPGEDAAMLVYLPVLVPDILSGVLVFPHILSGVLVFIRILSGVLVFVDHPTGRNTGRNLTSHLTAQPTLHCIAQDR